MFDRHPAILKAFEAGKVIGRDLRQRMEHGQGVWWDEMEPLSPSERGFVLALLRRELEPHRAPEDGLQLEVVKEAQATEAYEADADARAAEWREKSDKPDKRVKTVLQLSDLYKKRCN